MDILKLLSESSFAQVKQLFKSHTALYANIGERIIFLPCCGDCSGGLSQLSLLKHILAQEGLSIRDFEHSLSS